jgi:hypothetical protein
MRYYELYYLVSLTYYYIPRDQGKQLKFLTAEKGREVLELVNQR